MTHGGYVRGSKHGLRKGEYEQLSLAQNDACAGCLDTDVELHIDHDHRCCPGKYGCRNCIRCLLCQSCNSLMATNNDSSAQLVYQAEKLELRAKVLRRLADIVDV